MRNIKSIWVCLIMCVTMQVWSQDLHYSWYQFAPLTVNPALAGAFSGSYRINGIYSDKQGALTARNYRTFTLSADSPIMRGIRRQDWVGLGIEASMINPLNRSGLVTNLEPGGSSFTAFQTWTTMKIGAAYHLSLDKKRTRIFTLGAQYANNTRAYKNLSQADGRVNPMTGAVDLDIQRFNAFARQADPQKDYSLPFKDITVGVMYNVRNKKSDLKLGVAVEGINAPKVGLDTIPKLREKKYLGMNIHGAYEMEVNKRTWITPGFYYYSLGPSNGLNINTHVKYLLQPENELNLIGGLGFRNLRALSVYAGAEKKNIKIGMAFDVDLSSAAIGSKGVGGFEIVGSYIGTVYKKPKVKPEVFCPRLK
jgi:type IX secretion system PorP/SprF family membrane protein